MSGESHSRVSRIQALIDAAAALTSRLDVHGACEAMLDAVARIFDAQSSWILLHEPGSNRLETAAFRGPAGEAFAGFSVPADSGILGLAFSSGTPVFVPDVENEERWSDPDRFLAAGLASVFTVPLVHHDERIGAIGFYSPRFGPDSLPGDEERSLAQGLGALASVGIINARLFARVADERRRRVHVSRERRRLRDQVDQLREEMRGRFAQGGIIGRSPALMRVLEDVRMVAGADTTVLILGETGTGKELVARVIHEASRRAQRPFVPVNCAAMPATLLETELFGHEKGAFTGATERKAGRFEQAHAGTLFLDEIGDLAPEAQVRLLRVLEDGEVRRVGGTRPVAVDVRVIAATNADIAAKTSTGTFRPDLYFRLNVFPIQLPPLRQRSEDIPLLAEHFSDHFARRQHTGRPSIPADVMQLLQAYHWPGNVRELQNVIERAVILAKGGQVTRDLLPRPLQQLPSPGAGSQTLDPAVRGPEDPAPTLEEIQRRGILRALAESGWRISGDGGAAARLGLKPTTLHAKMKKLGLRRPGRRRR